MATKCICADCGLDLGPTMDLVGETELIKVLHRQSHARKDLHEALHLLARARRILPGNNDGLGREIDAFAKKYGWAI